MTPPYPKKNKMGMAQNQFGSNNRGHQVCNLNFKHLNLKHQKLAGAIAQPRGPILSEAVFAGAALVLWSPLGTFWGAFIRVAQLKECLALETSSGCNKNM